MHGIEKLEAHHRSDALASQAAQDVPLDVEGCADGQVRYEPSDLTQTVLAAVGV
jgi:hypothetical protein